MFGWNATEFAIFCSNWGQEIKKFMSNIFRDHLIDSICTLRIFNPICSSCLFDCLRFISCINCNVLIGYWKFVYLRELCLFIHMLYDQSRLRILYKTFYKPLHKCVFGKCEATTRTQMVPQGERARACER